MFGVRAAASGGYVALCAAALGLAFGFAPGLAASQSPEPEIGTTIVARNQVTGHLRANQREIKVGSRVYRDELIRTGPQAQAELRLDDDTKLALGPDAELRLDEFAVDTGADAKSMAVRLLKGTLRFLTGRQSSSNYRIVTPTATIGIRGTVFDLYISPAGETFVLMHQGVVEVCSQTGSCRKHRSIGRIVRVDAGGGVTVPGKWIEGHVKGVTAVEAFPFVGRILEVDRMKRMTHSTITESPNDPPRGGKQ